MRRRRRRAEARGAAERGPEPAEFGAGECGTGRIPAKRLVAVSYRASPSLSTERSSAGEWKVFHLYTTGILECWYSNQCKATIRRMPEYSVTIAYTVWGQELCIVSIVGQFGIPETTENGGKG